MSMFSMLLLFPIRFNQNRPPPPAYLFSCKSIDFDITIDLRIWQDGACATINRDDCVTYGVQFCFYLFSTFEIKGKIAAASRLILVNKMFLVSCIYVRFKNEMISNIFVIVPIVRFCLSTIYCYSYLYERVMSGEWDWWFGIQDSSCGLHIIGTLLVELLHTHHKSDSGDHERLIAALAYSVGAFGVSPVMG